MAHQSLQENQGCSIRPLVLCPRPRYEDPPPEPRLEGLATQHLADIVPTLHKVIALQ